MTPREALVRIAAGYAIAWLMPLAAWLAARDAERRGNARERVWLDDMAARLAAGAMNALPIVTGIATFVMLTA